MLRSEIIRAVSNLQVALKRSSVDELIMAAVGMHTTPDRPQANLIELYRLWVLSSNEFGETEKEILRIFRLAGLLDGDFWSSILIGKNDGRAQQLPRGSSLTIRRTLDRIGVLSRELPHVVQLLRREADPVLSLDKEETEPEGKMPSSIITILLKEDANRISSPRRLVDAIDSIDIIYDVFAEISGVSRNDLVVTGCDSGSDKSFDFTGVPQIIEQTRNLIFGMWDRVILYREKKHSERVKIVAESLPLLGEIAEMVIGRKLSVEQGELLKRRIIDGATKFLDTGAILPDLREASHFEPQALLQPAPTLLLQAPKVETTRREPEPHNQGRRRRGQSEGGEDEEEETILPEPGLNDDDVGQLSEEEREIIRMRRRDKS